VILTGLILKSEFGKSTVEIELSALVIAEANQKPFREQVTCDGIITPSKRVFIDATLNGKVINRFAINGTNITAGEPIIELKNSDLQLDILNKETQVLELINNINFTNITFAQNKVARMNELADTKYNYIESERAYVTGQKLFDSEVISDNEYKAILNKFNYLKDKLKLLDQAVINDSLTAIAQIKQMNVSLEQSRKNLLLMREKLDDLIVKAPITGQLSAFKLEEGELVSVGDNIGQIDVLDNFIIEAQVDQHFLHRVAIDQSAITTINGKPYQLKVQYINPSVENNFFKVHLEFLEQVPEELKRGQNVRVKIHLSGENPAITLKKGSFYQSTGGQYVYVLTSNNSAVKREIKVGRQNEEEFEILEGLEPGDKVIISSYNQFKDYELITIK
jgi:HlyD family secretion protein